MSESKVPRIVKLWCPSVSKIVPVVAWEEQKLDLGSIARVFGLDPSTLKLNGHYISRGVDLVSSSVTWRSLIKFFSSKGLSTGRNDKDALIVDGKLSKVGTKRTHDPLNAESRIHGRTEPEDAGVSRRLQSENINLLTNKKLKESNPECEEGHQVSKWNVVSFKRRQLLEDISLLKKLKINEGNSDSGRGKKHTSISLSGPSKCSYLNGHLKRMTDEEEVMTAPCKRMT